MNATNIIVQQVFPLIDQWESVQAKGHYREALNLLTQARDILVRHLDRLRGQTRVDAAKLLVKIARHERELRSHIAMSSGLH